MNDIPNDRSANEWDRLPTTPHSGGAIARAPAAAARVPALELQAPAPTAEDDDQIDLMAYWRIIVKRRWTVISVVVAAVALAVIKTLLTTPLYRATAVLQIDREPIRVLNAEGVIPSDNDWDDNFYQSQFELLKSRSMAERVVSAMNLAEDPSFERFSAPSPLRAFFNALLGAGPAEGGASKGEGEGGEGEARASARAVDAETLQRIQAGRIGWLMGALSVEPIRRSRLVRVSITSPDPDLSARVANGVAESFIEANLDRRIDASSFAKRFLETSLADMKGRLEASERALIEFAQQAELVEADSDSTLAAQNLTALNLSLAAAKDARIQAESRLRAAQTGRLDALPEVLASPLIGELRKNRSQLNAEYQQKLATFKPDFPEMRQLKGRIDEIDRQIEDATATIRASIEAEYRAALERENLLLAQLDAIKSEVLDVRGRSIQYNILKREVDTNRQQYEALLQRYQEVGLTGGVGSNNISIVDRAQPPGGPFQPNMTANVRIGLLLGLFLGIVLALLVEYLDDTIKTPQDIEKKLSLPVLGVIPKLKGSETVQAAMDDQRSGFSEAHRSLRTALLFATDHGAPRSLVVTSACMAEGKSTTAFALACNFAQLGKKTLLIDCDLRNPSLHRRIPGISNQNGLSNYLSGAIKPQEMVVSTGIENLSFAPTGPLPPNPAELLASPRMSALLTVASHKFDVVILDAPPVMGLADVPILSHIAAGTLIVVESAETRVGMVSAAVKRLLAARARIVGAVLTKYDAAQAGYGYGYGYGYGDSYYAYGGQRKRLGRA